MHKTIDEMTTAELEEYLAILKRSPGAREDYIDMIRSEICSRYLLAAQAARQCRSKR